MFENVAEHLDEAVRLAERCPEKYQVPCFEALIRVLAQSDSPLPQSGSSDGRLSMNSAPGDSAPGNGHRNGEATSTQSQGPLANGSQVSLGLEGQQTTGERGAIFLDQHQLPGASISRVYHLDGNSYRIIVKDLKEKTNSKKQRDMFIAQGNEWSLTVPAQQRAAEAIKELAS